MKSAIFSIIVVLFLGINSYAQVWTQQTSGTTESLRGVDFEDANTGTCVGTSGVILKTTNGGTTWTPHTGVTMQTLEAVQFFNASIGIAVGAYGTIIKTTNGGSNWAEQTSGISSYSIYGISFVTADIAVVVGGNGSLLRTTNGGSSWQSKTSGTSETLHSVSFFDANNGIAVGTNGVIIKSTDGGINWFALSSGVTAGLFCVSFIDANTATIVGGGGLILRTINGGTTWTSQTTGTASNLQGVSFLDANNGVAVGETGTILRTNNGGSNWYSQTSSTLYNIWAVKLITVDIATAVGDAGKIFKTINGSVPVELSSFNATNSNGKIKLDWETATESNNYGFNVEKKFAGKDWENVAFVKGNGTITSHNKYTYIDEVTGSGVIFYRLKQLDYEGNFEYSNVVEVTVDTPNEFSLAQNYPNPFNPSTVISFQLSVVSQTQLTVYDILGNEVATLVNETKEPGVYQVKFDGSGLTSGIYFYRLTAGNFTATKKFLLVK